MKGVALFLATMLSGCGNAQIENMSSTDSMPSNIQQALSNEFDDEPAVNGLTATYYSNIDFSGPSVTRIDKNIQFDWGTSTPATGIDPTTYSVRWVGQIKPRYSETYTFHLTHSDGARLFVNGKKMTVDTGWKEQRHFDTRSDIQLTANTNYDIRIEYFRGATNPAQIKLVWHSASQAAEVVPSDRLSSVMADTKRALNIVTTSSDAIRLSIKPHALTSLVSRGENQSLSFAGFDPTSRKSIIAFIKNDKVVLSFGIEPKADSFIIYESRRKKSLEIQRSDFYTDIENDVIDPTKVDTYAAKLFSLMFDLGPTSWTGATPLTADPACLASPVLIICPLCSAYEQEIREILCDFKGMVTFPSIAISAGFFGGKKVFIYGLGLWNQSWAMLAQKAFGYYTIWKLSGLAHQYNTLKEFEDKLDACLAANLATCGAKMIGPDPNPLTIESEINTSGTRVISVGIDPASTSYLRYLPAAEGDLNKRGIYLGFNPGYEPYMMWPTSLNAVIPIRYYCGSSPATYSGTLAVYHFNVQNKSENPIRVPITLKCTAKPKLEATPAVDMTTYVNSVMPEKFLVWNSGNADLNHKVSPPTKSWLKLSQLNGTISPGGSHAISILGICPATPMTDSEVLTVTDPAYGQSKQVKISLTCLPNDTGGRWSLVGIVDVTITSAEVLDPCPRGSPNLIKESFFNSHAVYTYSDAAVTTIKGPTVTKPTIPFYSHLTIPHCNGPIHRAVPDATFALIASAKEAAQTIVFDSLNHPLAHANYKSQAIANKIRISLPRPFDPLLLPTANIWVWVRF